MTAPSIDAHIVTRFEPPAKAPLATDPAPAVIWPIWQRVLFRFFSVYFLLHIEPWNWFRDVPGVNAVTGVYFRAMDWAVRGANSQLFHIRDTLVMPNGSGDTSWAWAQAGLEVLIAAVVCAVWSIADRRRPNYSRMAQWLRLIVRYYIATAALSYGIIKLFALQMAFPTLSQLATPLGDLLPMRFSWLFIGYSLPYQFFSGAMETVAGLLLLYRRTITAGLFAATGAFMNVVMINIAYDVPVKLFAMHLLFSCVFLMMLDSERLLRFLVLNQTTPPTAAYEPLYTRGWQRWGGIAVKAFIVLQILVLPLQSGWQRYKALQQPGNPGPFAAGYYEVRHYVVNHDTVSAAKADTLAWRDVIIDNAGAGSINTGDQVFWQRYHRGYFRYKPNAATHTMAVWKTSTIPRDSTFLFTMRYEVPDSSTIRFHTLIRGDSVHAELVRVPRHFQLAERQFHWISEYNR